MKLLKSRMLNLAKKPDSDIDYSDIAELDETFWQNAKPELPKKKKSVSIRLDDDLLSWFRNQGKGYQTMINSVLKSYMLAHKKR